MRVLVQRVLRAEVTSRPVGAGDDTWESVGSIEPGLCVFVGATHDDTDAIAVKMAAKIWGLRILADEDGAMNRSLSDLAESSQPEVLVVSQFTLYGETTKGRRPSWTNAARPEHAEGLVERVADMLTELGASVATGRFRTDMRVELVNDGPCTLMLEL
jgi:D-aminoacyl-tRNA deacylase